MATKIETFAVRESKSKFPWNDWTDGSVWELRKGDDYTTDAINMRANLYNHACKRCLKVKSMILDDGARIQFKFEPSTRKPKAK